MKSYELSFGDQIIAVFDTGLPLFSFKLKKPIDEGALKGAVDDALAKHPLYRSRLAFEDGLYKYIENDLSPVVFHDSWDKPIEYGTEINNYYPWLVMWDEDEIHFTAAHSLSDGGGAARFAKSLLLAYLTRTGTSLPEGLDISLEDADKTTEILGELHRDPDNEPFMVPKEKEVIDTNPDMYEMDIDKISAYDISFKQADIKKIAAKSETTTFAALAAVLAIAYDKMLNLSEGNIKVEVPFDMRGYWDSVSDHNYVEMASLYYPIEKLKGKDINLVQTAFRSQLDIYMDRTNQVEKFNKQYGMKQMLAANPSMLEQMTKALTDRLFMPKASIVLTHLGNLGFPKELLDEIVDFNLTSGVFPGSMMAAVGYLHNDIITLNMIQATKEDVYIDKLKETLEEQDISYEIKKVIPHGALSFARPNISNSAI